jgi:hypothetical protein
MAGPLIVDPAYVFRLPPPSFTLFCNDLLRAEAGRLGMSQVHVDTTVRETVPDGGMDACVRHATYVPGWSGSRWFPEGNSSWQFKSGKCPSAPDLSRQEFTKPEVIAAIDRDDTYCFLTADSLTSRKKTNIAKAIREQYTARGKRPIEPHIYSGDDLARWALEHLGIALRHFLVPVSGWQPFEQWANASRFRNEYFPDAARHQLFTDVRAWIAQQQRLIRIVGYAGVGKTRAAMEALRPDGLSQRVLYLEDAARLDPNFFWYLQHENPQGSGLLVVDECTAAEFQRLRDLADTLPSGFTVLAVGPFEYGGQSYALELGPLQVDELAKLLGSFVPGLDESQRRAIAARCGGSPKLVQVIAMSIAEQADQIRSWTEIESHLNVVEYLEQRVFRTDENNPETHTMRVLCLFSRLGWERELESEGRTVCEFFGLSWNDARLAAQALMRRGIVSRRGRYLYPTPDVLANYLARRTIEALGTQQLRVLCERLGDAARAAFADRLRQLGEDPQTREIVDLLLGAEGFFVQLEDLNEPGKADLLRRLALAFPKRVVNRLGALLGPASREQLLVLSAGRRQVVWTLEELAWWSDTFEPAARLLLRLAWAENENIANNATGIWTRLFQVVLSGTEVPFAERFRFLQEVLADPEPQIRKLGVDALSATLQAGHIIRSGGPPEDAGKLPPKEWNPATYREWRELLRPCLVTLDQLLHDSDKAVQDATRAILVDRGADIINASFVDEWIELVSGFTNSPFDVRKPLLKIVRRRLKHPDDLPKTAVERLHRLEAELAGYSLGDELHRVIGSWNELMEGNFEDQEKVIAQLAEHAISDPEKFDEHLDWLFSGEANSGFEFGKELGRLDTRDQWFTPLVARFKTGDGDDRFITGYLYGAKIRKGEEWLEDQLDQWMQEPELQPLVGPTTWRALSTDRAASRLAMMIRDGSLPAAYLGILAGSWARQVSPEAIIALLQAAVVDQSHDAVSGRLAFLAQYVKEYPESLECLRSHVKGVLNDISRHPFSTMDGFYWQVLAEKLLPASPIEVAEICVNAVHYAAQTHHLVDDHVRQVFSEVARVGGWRIFEEVLGPALIENPRILQTLDLSLFEGHSLSLNYDPSLIVTWIEKDVAHRLSIISYAVRVGGKPLADPARALLVRWGDREVVRSYLTEAFFTDAFADAWIGPETAWLGAKLDEAQSWLKDPDPHVRAWAAELVETIQKQREQAQIHEEERGW